MISLLLSLLLRAGLDLAAFWAWPLPAPIHLLAAAALLGLSVFVLRDAQRRELLKARRAPLVAQLHAGYVWLGLSLALDALAQGAAGLGRPDLQRALAMAALDALTLGFMGTTLLAMASRVSAVQQGRSVAVDRCQSLMQALLQLLTAGRLAAALAPVWPGLVVLLPAVALVYLVMALAWSLRYGPWLLQRGRARPRER